LSCSSQLKTVKRVKLKSLNISKITEIFARHVNFQFQQQENKLLELTKLNMLGAIPKLIMVILPCSTLGSEISDMTFEGLGEMFEGDSTDTLPEDFR
jgi:hypothetical protein